MDAKQGLYASAYEHDACGVGMVVNIHGGKSHELVDNALRVLENMQHRGAETRDKTGDGAGIMVQIPHEFILLQGILRSIAQKTFRHGDKHHRRYQTEGYRKRIHRAQPGSFLPLSCSEGRREVFPTQQRPFQL